MILRNKIVYCFFLFFFSFFLALANTTIKNNYKKKIIKKVNVINKKKSNKKVNEQVLIIDDELIEGDGTAANPLHLSAGASHILNTGSKFFNNSNILFTDIEGEVGVLYPTKENIYRGDVITSPSGMLTVSYTEPINIGDTLYHIIPIEENVNALGTLLDIRGKSEIGIPKNMLYYWSSRYLVGDSTLRLFTGLSNRAAIIKEIGYDTIHFSFNIPTDTIHSVYFNSIDSVEDIYIDNNKPWDNTNILYDNLNFSSNYQVDSTYISFTDLSKKDYPYINEINFSSLKKSNLVSSAKINYLVNEKVVFSLISDGNDRLFVEDLVDGSWNNIAQISGDSLIFSTFFSTTVSMDKNRKVLIISPSYKKNVKVEITTKGDLPIDAKDVLSCTFNTFYPTKVYFKFGDTYYKTITSRQSRQRPILIDTTYSFTCNNILDFSSNKIYSIPSKVKIIDHTTYIEIQDVYSPDKGFKYCTLVSSLKDDPNNMAVISSNINNGINPFIIEISGEPIVDAVHGTTKLNVYRRIDSEKPLYIGIPPLGHQNFGTLDNSIKGYIAKNINNDWSYVGAFPDSTNSSTVAILGWHKDIFQEGGIAYILYGDLQKTNDIRFYTFNSKLPIINTCAEYLQVLNTTIPSTYEYLDFIWGIDKKSQNINSGWMHPTTFIPISFIPLPGRIPQVGDKVMLYNHSMGQISNIKIVNEKDDISQILVGNIISSLYNDLIFSQNINISPFNYTNTILPNEDNAHYFTNFNGDKVSSSISAFIFDKDGNMGYKTKGTTVHTIKGRNPISSIVKICPFVSNDTLIHLKDSTFFWFSSTKVFWKVADTEVKFHDTKGRNYFWDTRNALHCSDTNVWYTAALVEGKMLLLPNSKTIGETITYVCDNPIDFYECIDPKENLYKPRVGNMFTLSADTMKRLTGQIGGFLYDTIGALKAIPIGKIPMTGDNNVAESYCHYFDIKSNGEYRNDYLILPYRERKRIAMEKEKARLRKEKKKLKKRNGITTK